jgi:hypothetical protein
MPAAAFILDDTAGEIGPVSGRSAHLHSLNLIPVSAASRARL